MAEEKNKEEEQANKAKEENEVIDQTINMCGWRPVPTSGSVQFCAATTS